jgi:hypothetical protein
MGSRPYQLNLDQKSRVKNRFGYPHHVHLLRREIQYHLETKHFPWMRWGWHSRGPHIRRRLGLHQSIRFWKREVVRVHMQPERPSCRAPSILSTTEILFAQEEIPARVDGVNAIWTSGQSELRPVQLVRSIAPKRKLNNIPNLGRDILRKTYIRVTL